MSNQAMTWAIDCDGLALPTKAILMLLADCHNGSTGKCYPNESWLAEKAGVSGRTVRMHLKALEDAKLVERLYEHGGRGVGRKFAGYDLKIGISGAVIKPQNDTEIEQDIATAESCHGREMSLPRQDTATPYKDKPEIEPESICGKSALDEIWPHWSAVGRKRSESKTKLIARLNRMAKVSDLEQVIKASRMYAKGTDGQYHAGLHTFLKSGQWENWIGDDRTPEQPTEISLEDWKDAARSYCELNIWPRGRLGPAPHEPGCRAPAGLLRGIAARMDGHANADAILSNLELGEAA